MCKLLFVNILSSLFLLASLGSCSSPSSTHTDENKSDVKVSDTIRVQEAGDSIKEVITGSKRQFTSKELPELMDYLNEQIEKTPIKYNVQAWALMEVEKQIKVQLIVCNEKTINEFKKYVIDSPFIIFKEVESHRPTEEVCESCGFKMIASPAVYKLPVRDISVKISNNTKEEGMTGEYFYIEYYSETNWEKVPLNSFFNSLGYPVEAHQIRVFSVNIQPEVYDYKAGKYRVYKRIIIDKKTYALISEFRIE